MLVALVIAGWLFGLLILVALCRSAARGDGNQHRQASP
jgi:hypothetical protein